MSLVEPITLAPLAQWGRLHFIALGGAGMSAVAAGAVAAGRPVSGCDQVDSAALRAVERAGARVWVGHDPAHLDQADAVVVSSAIAADNPELLAARQRGLPVLHRSAALGALMIGHRGVAIAGTHGKTTTTALSVAGWRACGTDPSYVLGGTLLGDDLGAHLGSGDLFLVEADEHDGSFLQYPAQVVVVTSLDADHLDRWGTPQAYADGFLRFAAQAEVVCAIVNIDDDGGAWLADQLARRQRRLLRYGVGPAADLRLSRPQLGPATSQGVVSLGGWSAQLRLGVPGAHNLSNATAALAVAVALDADREAYLDGLAQFAGTTRRFQRIGQAGSVVVVDDYAHHPREVAATIATARLVGPQRVVVCFQPHLYSRTRDFADQFGAALAQADQVVVLDVYPAREAPIPGIDGQLVAQAVARHGGQVTYQPGLDDALAALVALARPGDLVVTMGAGSVTSLAGALLARLEAR
jgi:UDP-N-acetylmuramate--alanine ligase